MDEATGGPVASWSKAMGHVSKGVLAANRAATAGLTARVKQNGEEESWTLERTVERREDISVGDTVRFSKPLTEDDVSAFAHVTGDTNELHLDDEFAAETRFGSRIVHGTLVAGTISAALARFPGLTIYLSQELEFQRPVALESRVTAVVEVVEDLGEGRYRLTTQVHDEDGTVVIDGEATVLIDERPGEE